MEDILPKLLSFPPHPPPPNSISDHRYDEGMRIQIHTVKAIPDSKLLQQTSGGENLLEFINPSLNTASYAFILLAHLSPKNKDMDLEKLWGSLSNFLSNFDPRQMRYLGGELSHIIDYAISFARRGGQLALAIPPVRDALLRFDPTGAMLTSKHLALVKMAIETRNFDDVLPVLEKSILYIPATGDQPKPKYICDTSLPAAAYITPTCGFTAKIMKASEVLEYFFLCGHIYIGLRNWKKAQQWLENAVTYPSKEAFISKIMVDAYKRWVLVSVLLNGKVPTLPRTTGFNASKQYHVLAKPYNSIAQIFEGGTASRLKAEAEHGRTIWAQDFNTGLIVNVLGTYQKFQIRKLADVYSKIYISEVHNLTMSAETGGKLPSSDAVESLVESMIQEGSLYATLSHPPTGSAILAFSKNRPVLTEKQMQTELAASSIRIKTLIQEIKNTDRMMTYTKDFARYVQKQKKTAKNPPDQGISTDLDSNAAEDEDLMGSLY